MPSLMKRFIDNMDIRSELEKRGITDNPIMHVKEGYSLRFHQYNEISKDYIKFMIISSASWYEERIIEQLNQYFAKVIKREYLHSIHFIKKAVLDRGYYSLFDWRAYNSNQETANINSFLSYFGESVKNPAEEYIKSSPRMRKSIHDFLVISEERNRLIHGNVLYASNKYTLEEISKMHDSACYFVDNCLNIIENKFEIIERVNNQNDLE